MVEQRGWKRAAPEPSNPEGRERLLRKLQALIVILEVALMRVRVEMRGPKADTERLGRVSENLSRTLRVCRRALAGLERGESVLSDPQGEAAQEVSPPSGPRAMTYRDYVELSTVDEFQRFRRLPPLRAEEVRAVDLDRLLALLVAP